MQYQTSATGKSKQLHLEMLLGKHRTNSQVQTMFDASPSSKEQLQDFAQNLQMILHISLKKDTTQDGRLENKGAGLII